MKSILFNDIVKGLDSLGWRIKGGNDTNFLIMEKEDKVIKLFGEAFNGITVRYSVCDYQDDIEKEK